MKHQSNNPASAFVGLGTVFSETLGTEVPLSYYHIPKTSAHTERNEFVALDWLGGRTQGGECSVKCETSVILADARFTCGNFKITIFSSKADLDCWKSSVNFKNFRLRRSVLHYFVLH